MKIYFAGSIRGGREDKDLYLEIITLLQSYGEVLTEHVGDKNLTSYGETKMTENEIYERDVNWIHEADIVVAEVTAVSLGVGYEIGYAESLNKKIVALYRPSEGKRLSAMINGDEKIHTINYQEISELPAIFDKILK